MINEKVTDGLGYEEDEEKDDGNEVSPYADLFIKKEKVDMEKIIQEKKLDKSEQVLLFTNQNSETGLTEKVNELLRETQIKNILNEIIKNGDLGRTKRDELNFNQQVGVVLAWILTKLKDIEAKL